MRFSLRLYGRFQLLAPNGESIAIPSRKHRVLIAMLALAGGKPVPRSKLAGLLWPEQNEEHARNSLRQALFAIRHAVEGHGPSPVVIDHAAGWIEKGALACDVDALAEATATGWLDLSGDSYDGELLEGLSFQDETLDTWLHIERDRHRDRLIDCLTAFAVAMEKAGDAGQALAAARCTLLHDPYHEPAHRVILRGHLERGERARALRHCDTLQALLESGLGVPMDPETRKLVDHIRGEAGGIPAPDGPPAYSPTAQNRPRVAVLPMVNLSRNDALDGVTETLTRRMIAELGRFSPVSVVAAATMLALRTKDLTMEEIGRRVNAAYVVELSCEAAQEGGAVLVQLVSVHSGTQIWSRRYPATALDAADGQDRLIRAIVGSLYQILMWHAAGDADAEPQENAGAEQLYLQVFYHIQRPTRAGMVLARRLCDRLLEADPRHVLVRESLAWADFHCAFNGWTEDPQEAFRQARDRVLAGLRLNDREPYLLSALGLAQTYLGDVRAGLDALRRATDLNPNDAEFHTWLGTGLTCAGRIEEAHAAFDQADQINPGYHPVFLFRADAHLSSGEFERAVAGLDHFLAVLPEYHWARLLRAAAHDALGETERARADVDHVRQATPSLDGRYLQRLLLARAEGYRDWLTERLGAAGLL
ncbi:hypothetical protein OCK02_05030 (plasmid) [Rhizobium sp. TRM96647]|uniref:BTAD domain-containing putative transcriptional regulator n=1 Tax=unclassified Rhizobium TaxID=2613769 RepID=UPI0021E771C2|nr:MULTISPECIES: BTAD domain-containing putative transcriptional regulator [unclassified Rhizobium]MCV3735560.1 hypothetical protein [Rhizobium sp. TRM96647]MCV3757677.1 hypothetical protein [Rhizobium sp. TRM96650]